MGDWRTLSVPQVLFREIWVITDFCEFFGGARRANLQLWFSRVNQGRGGANYNYGFRESIFTFLFSEGRGVIASLNSPNRMFGLRSVRRSG